MTNAGLLPNYAFPEEGVSLTTIIHGARSASGEEYSVPLHRYSRPAHAALAEFAPRNTFFAHKSKVEVDQIDMSVSDSVFPLAGGLVIDDSLLDEDAKVARLISIPVNESEFICKTNALVRQDHPM